MSKITIKSKVKDVYAHPIGRDIIRRILLQMKVSDRVVNNPIVGNLSLKTLEKCTRKQLGSGFFETLVQLLNHETDKPAPSDCEISKKWWKEAVFYQVYPRSFCDGNGDHLGDLKGIIERLDYLENLGVDALWLSPIYDSPQEDNGYDIRDYRKIWDQFGDMEDFDILLKELHRRSMKLIMDLVVNHTSDEHEWFQSALHDENSPYKDYYIFKEGNGENPPNNWTSFFSGSAWNYYEEKKSWALHLFSKKQMDLNWENPALRSDVIDMIRWWLEKGVDGFRMDVINYISKTQGLPDGDEQIGALMGYYGIEHYFYGPKLHDYLREVREKAFDPYQAFSVGETPGIGMEMSKLITGDDRGELDMVFSFDHLETPGHVRFDDYAYDLNYLKKYYIDWMENYGNHCWMSLFFENHDNPRMISKIESNKIYHAPLAKLLLTIQLTLRGTPFIYQGQELGMANVDFHRIEELSDVESINLYHELVKTKTKEEAFKIVLSGTRDHARVMMDWKRAEKQFNENDSVYQYAQKMIEIRRKYTTLIYGDVIFIHKKTKDLFTYYRHKGEKLWYIECNLSNHEIDRPVVKGEKRHFIGNYPTEEAKLKPYEVNVYRFSSDEALQMTKASDRM